MDAPQFNKEMDHLLSSTGVVDQDVFVQLAEAYGYGAATTIGWVQVKLDVLNVRIAKGQSVWLYEPSQGRAIPVSTTAAFANWVAQHFPGVSLAAVSA